MVHQELSVIHSREDLDLDAGIDSLQMLHLRLGHEGFLRPVPEMDVGAVDGLQFVGIDGLVPVQDGTPAAEWIDLPAFIQQHIEVVGMEHPTPESRPVEWQYQQYGLGLWE